MRFEYTVRRPTDNHKTLIHIEDKFLAQMGEAGWDLCCILDIDNKRRAYYFKRPLDEAAPSIPADPNIWINVFIDIEDGMTILDLKSKYKITKI